MQPISNLIQLPEEIFSIIVQHLPAEGRGKLRQASQSYYTHKALEEKDDWLDANSVASRVIKKFLFKNGVNSISKLMTDKIKNSVTHLRLYDLKIPQEWGKNDKWLKTILESFKNLKELSINSTEIERASTFKAFPKSLEKLECNYCGLSDKSIEAMAHLENLKELDVHGNRKIKGKTFQKLPESVTKLIAIDYSSLPDLNNISSYLDEISKRQTEFCKARKLQ